VQAASTVAVTANVPVLCAAKLFAPRPAAAMAKTAIKALASRFEFSCLKLMFIVVPLR